MWVVPEKTWMWPDLSINSKQIWVPVGHQEPGPCLFSYSKMLLHLHSILLAYSFLLILSKVKHPARCLLYKLHDSTSKETVVWWQAWDYSDTPATGVQKPCPPNCVVRMWVCTSQRVHYRLYVICLIHIFINFTVSASKYQFYFWLTTSCPSFYFLWVQWGTWGYIIYC